MRSIWDPRYRDAYDFARHAHEGQKRKYTGVDYIWHPISVAHEVANRQEDYYQGVADLSREIMDAQIQAAFLHDTVEDTPVEIDDIEYKFGELTARIVSDLTEVFTSEDFPYMNRAERKDMELRRLRRIAPMSRLVKYADIIDNTRDIVANDPDFATVYLREKADILEALGYGK